MMPVVEGGEVKTQIIGCRISSCLFNLLPKFTKQQLKPHSANVCYSACLGSRNALWTGHAMSGVISKLRGQKCRAISELATCAFPGY